MSATTLDLIAAVEKAKREIRDDEDACFKHNTSYGEMEMARGFFMPLVFCDPDLRPRLMSQRRKHLLWLLEAL